jgi:hypothetical protein
MQNNKHGKGWYIMKKTRKGKMTIREKLELLKAIAQRNEQRRKEFEEKNKQKD